MIYCVLNYVSNDTNYRGTGSRLMNEIIAIAEFGTQVVECIPSPE
jgi:hypothetical protein